MNLDKVITQLEEFATEYPDYLMDVRVLAVKLRLCLDDGWEEILKSYFLSHSEMHNVFRAYLSQRSRTFRIYHGIPEHLQSRLKQAQAIDHLKSWADTVHAVPNQTDPLPIISGTF